MPAVAFRHSESNPALSVGYSAASRAEKSIIAVEHRYFVQGLLWFWQNDTSVPESHRKRHQKYGLCKDEWPGNGHFPRQLYVREAIRMIGDRVFTQNDRTPDCREDSIAVATWFFDIHYVKRVAIKNEKDVWTAFNEGCVGRKDPLIPFDLPYWVILPKKSEVTNLAVTNCPSVSHVAFSAIQEEPTLWALGMAAGIAASMAVTGNLGCYHPVDIVALRAEIEKRGGRYHFPSKEIVCPN